MVNSKFLAGIKIISEKMPDEMKDEYSIHAGHEQIWFGLEDWVQDEFAIETLKNLGWFIDGDSWSCFA